MKKMILLLIAVIITVTFTSLKTADTILASLGLNSEKANASLVKNLPGIEEFKLPYMKIAPEILTGDKTGAAKEVCAYIKSYCESSTFAADYEKYRQKNKPAEFEIAQNDDEQLEEMRQAAKTWEEGSKDKSLSKATRDEYKAMADDMKEGVARAEDPLFDWKRDYPEDPSVLLRKNLEEYLALVKTVDFNAQLTQPDEYNTRKFVNPEYESKSLQWKAIYRAGSEVNVVATEFAKNWLAAGIKTGQTGYVPQNTDKTESDSPKTMLNEEKPADAANAHAQPESLRSKTKGMMKSLKDKVVKIP